MKSVFIITQPDGSIWRDSARSDHNSCRDEFVRDWLSPVSKNMDSHMCWNLWQAFEKSGYRISEIEVSNEDRLQSLMDWNRDFAKRVFPKHADDPKAPLHHLKEEIKELIEAIDQKDEAAILKEYADCLILLTGSAIRLKLSADDLVEASHQKMAVNENRDWGEPDEKGVYHHTK